MRRRRFRSRVRPGRRVFRGRRMSFRRRRGGAGPRRIGYRL